MHGWTAIADIRGVAPSRIFLTGFMGSGKSRIGRELSALMNIRFVDLDREIERRIGPITPFFQKEGEAAFREVERDVLQALLPEDEMVLATGGGTPFFFDNMERMQLAGTVVYLDVSVEVLQKRLLRTGRDRPLLFGANDDELRQRVSDLLARRLPDYRRAGVVVDADADPPTVAARIVQALGKDR